MKKLVLVLVSAVILIVFLAFNYLLWDRENKIKSFESINDSKNSSIDALRREIENTAENNKQLKAKASNLQDAADSLLLRNSDLEKEKSNIEKSLSEKSEIINKLKLKADLTPLEDIVRRWVESVEKGQYEVAYNLLYSHSQSLVTSAPSLYEFSSKYKDSIKSIKIKSMKLYSEGLPESRKGDIIYKVVLDIKKSGSSYENTFIDGINERFFLISYDKLKDQWVIASISTVP